MRQMRKPAREVLRAQHLAAPRHRGDRLLLAPPRPRRLGYALRVMRQGREAPARRLGDLAPADRIGPEPADAGQLDALLRRQHGLPVLADPEMRAGE